MPDSRLSRKTEFERKDTLEWSFGVGGMVSNPLIDTSVQGYCRL